MLPSVRRSLADEGRKQKDLIDLEKDVVGIGSFKERNIAATGAIGSLHPRGKHLAKGNF